MAPDLEITRCVTDEDYEQWRQVRIAVLPYERSSPWPSSGAGREGHPADAAGPARATSWSARGWPTARTPRLPGLGAPRVLPEHRRRGVGTALLHRWPTTSPVSSCHRVRATVDDEESLAFAQAFGFADIDHEVEQTYVGGGPPRPTEAPAGIEVVSIGASGLWAEPRTFGREVLADFACPRRST